MVGPGTRGFGPGLGLKYDNCVAGRAGPGHTFCGPGPHNSVCGQGPGRVCTTAAGPGRAWASNHICGPGLGLNFRPVQGPIIYARDSFNPKSERLEFQRPTHQPEFGQFSRVQISKRVMISLQSERTSIQVSTELINCPHDSQAPVNFLLAYAIRNIVSPCF